MSEVQNPQDAAAGQEPPVFHVAKLYLKDLSFESPNAPDAFGETGEPKAEFNLDTKAARKSDDHYEVTLQVTVTVKDASGEKTMFLAEVVYAGLFLIKNIPEQHLPMVLGIECPNILFPYLRQLVSSVVQDGGFKPMVLDPINFAALFQQAQQQQAAQQAAN
ncbi:protein-export chaperone SecB [Magnetofaba australis]|uniref:Putative preprotein translocase subunit SecB n=1 Tax=Magnetofaba australis IT-1 TaxID=1434232 RepID=A0A1Y2K8G0_9PROT|nr:protein-export chaperone SecB [Magnetofaba australis]OSM06787.1 putative preprotein translocase subunit SecB [Magnetofaba australis IT-1]